MKRTYLKPFAVVLSFATISIASPNLFAMSKAKSVYNSVKSKVVSFVQNGIGSYSGCTNCQSVWNPNSVNNNASIEYPRTYDRPVSSSNPFWFALPKGI